MAGFDEVVVLEDTDFDAFLSTMAALAKRRLEYDSTYKLRFAIDEGGLKYKSDEGAWSPARGTLERPVNTAEKPALNSFGLATQLVAIQAQIYRYFAAVYGDNFVYAAPETFPNVLEQWMLAVRAENLDIADELMTKIETLAAEHKGSQ